MEKRRQDIPPIALIIIGLIVGVSSIFINISSESNFSLFVIAGFTMAGYGSIKFFLSARVDKQDKNIERTHNKSSQQHEFSHQRQHQNSEQHQTNQGHHNSHTAHVSHVNKSSSFIFCPGCGGRLPGKVNFCPHCGARLN